MSSSQPIRGERPAGLVRGRRTPTFTATTVPPALLGNHHTTVWAQLEVEAGTVEFIEENSDWRAVASATSPVTIVPNQPHRIVPSPEAVFAVQFFVDPTDQTQRS